MQIQIEAALADAVAGELAGIRRERGQLDLAEAGGDVQALQRIEWRQTALDAHRRVLVHLAGDVHRGGFLLAIAQDADVTIE